MNVNIIPFFTIFLAISYHVHQNPIHSLQELKLHSTTESETAREGLASIEALETTEETTGFKGIVFSEILSDPTPVVGLPDAEYIEIYNPSNQIISLNGWRITDITSSSSPFPDIALNPQAFLVICKSTDVDKFGDITNIISLNSWPSLNNATDSLTLLNANDEVIDYLVYEDDWHETVDKRNGGYSLELINPYNICMDARNWDSSIASDGGSPGAINSIWDETITPPEIMLTRPLDDDKMLITFNLGLDANNISNAQIAVSNLSISSMEVNDNELIVNFSSTMEHGENYSLNIQDLPFCNGNQLSEMEEFLFLDNTIAEYKSIIITEIMANPSAEISSPNAEFVEIYNRSVEPINIHQWILGDKSETTALIPYYILYPDEYLIIHDVDETSEFIDYNNKIEVDELPALNNAGDSLYILSADHQLIDQVNYQSSWYRDNIKADGGYSLEIIQRDYLCSDKSNWLASNHSSGATPGILNSVDNVITDFNAPQIAQAYGIDKETIVIAFNEPILIENLSSIQIQFEPPLQYSSFLIIDNQYLHITLEPSNALNPDTNYLVKLSGLSDCMGNVMTEEVVAEFNLYQTADYEDIIINEILFDPQPGGVDYVEIYNRSDKYISLRNWHLANAVSDSDTIKLETSKSISETFHPIAPNGYIVITSDAETTKNYFPRAHLTSILEISPMPSYNDDEGTVVLMNDNGQIIDWFNYNKDMHSQLLQDTEGVSLERLNPFISAQQYNNWFSAAGTHQYGTPGYKNSQQFISDIGGELEISPKIITPNNDGLDDFITISYQFDNPGAMLSISVLNVRGQIVKRLVNQQFIGNDGFIVWDGSAENGQSLSVGHYILLIEYFDGEGRAFQKKEVVAVGPSY